MKIGIIFLGNPGLKYKNTKHNYGYMLFNKLIDVSYNTENDYSINFIKCVDHSEYITYVHQFKDRECFLIKTLTGINNTGNILKKYNFRFDLSIVIVDDIYLKFKKNKLHRKKIHNGHNGLKSIFNIWDNNYNIFLYRLGIGPQNMMDLDKFVLSKFTQSDIKFILSKSISGVWSMLNKIFFSSKDKMIEEIMNECNVTYE